MQIVRGSMRFTDHNNEKLIFEPDSEMYKSYCHVAQEIWDHHLHIWKKIPDRYPTRINSGDDYNVYLNGQIVPWWSAADSLRGFVDVIVGSNIKHRLFGEIKFEARVFNEM